MTTLTGVQAPLGVELGVTGELGVADSEDLNPDQLGDAEGQGKAGPGGTIKLNLAGINPGQEKRIDRQIRLSRSAFF